MEASCPGCFKHFKRSSARPYCNAKCKERDDANKAHKARMFRKDEAYRLFYARGVGGEIYTMVEEAMNERIALPSKEEIDAELGRIFETLSAHESCRDHFITYGRKGYAKSHGGVASCEICGDTLICGGERRKHKFRELSPTECHERGIYHAGRCWHTYLCTNPGCDYIRSYDSSD